VIAISGFGIQRGIFSLLWWHPFLLTLNLMAVTVILSGAMGILGAWAASSVQSSGRLGGLIARLFVAAMIAAIAMPMILHAAAWESTAGKFGWLPLTQTGSRSTAIGAFGAFGGLTACGWIHGLVGAAIVALATWHGAERVPSSAIAHGSLDAGPTTIWWRIRVPLAMPWIVSGLIGAAALAATEMTVVDLYGYRTVADEFYLYHSIDASTSAILITCLIPLSMAAILILQRVLWRHRLLSVGGQEGGETKGSESLSPGMRVLACAAALIVAGIVSVVPLLGLVIKAGHHVVVDEGVRSTSWSLDQFLQTVAWAPVTFTAEYSWTAVIAAGTASVAVSLGWLAASMGRTHPVAGRWMDAVTVVLVLVPGPIVGLGVVRFFQWDVPGFRVLYQQSLIPTILALLVRAGPVAYWILRAGYRGIDDRVLATAKMDRSWIGRVWTIDRPLLKKSLLAASLGSAIVASGDVPAMLPVIPPGVTTVGTRLFELLHNGARYQEAALALWYVGAVVAIVLVWMKWGASSRVKMIG
jgi:iron(III) transport system permease protein